MGDGKFKEGHDPRRNPGGRPAMSEEARLAFERMEPKALKKLDEFLDGDDPKMAMEALKVVIERRMGKAVQPTDNTTTLSNPDGSPIARIVVAPLSPEDNGTPPGDT